MRDPAVPFDPLFRAIVSSIARADIHVPSGPGGDENVTITQTQSATHLIAPANQTESFHFSKNPKTNQNGRIPFSQSFRATADRKRFRLVSWRLGNLADSPRKDAVSLSRTNPRPSKALIPVGTGVASRRKEQREHAQRAYGLIRNSFWKPQCRSNKKYTRFF